MKPEQLLKQYGPIAIILIVLYFLFKGKKNDPAQTDTATGDGGTLGSDTGGVVPTNDGGSKVPTNDGSSDIPMNTLPSTGGGQTGGGIISDPYPWMLPDDAIPGQTTSQPTGSTALTIRM